MNQVGVLVAKDVGELVKETVDSVTDYLKTKEVEKTEREKVKACLTAVTKKFEEDRKKFEDFLDKSFEEREKLYNQAEKVMDKALKDDNLELVKVSVNMMLTVYNKNPMDGYEKVNSNNNVSSKIEDNIGKFIE